MIRITTPISEKDLAKLYPGAMVLLSGELYAGRDAVLPLVVRDYQEGKLDAEIKLSGMAIFHTAVSPAGVGPTSSNKVEIEESIVPLSKAGVRLHLGKGKIGKSTVTEMSKEGSVFAVVPPVTALLNARTKRCELVAHPELGMEALYRLVVVDYPCVIAAVNGASIFNE